MYKNKRLWRRLLGLVGSLCWLVSGPLLAVPNGLYAVNPVDLRGRDLPGFFPNVEFGVGHDDNVLRTETNTRASGFARLAPELLWVGNVRKHRLRFGYQGEYARYFDEANDNYNDHYLGADATLDLTQKFSVNGGLFYFKSHEGRGAAGAINSGLEPNEWDQWTARVEALYGRRVATAQLGFLYEHSDREYTNNQQSDRDNQTDTLTFTVYYNLGRRTQLLIEPSLIHTDYVRPTVTPGLPEQDNKVRQLLAGIIWSATAKTTGKVKVGGYRKDFENFSDVSGYSADVEIVWEPKTYSTVTLKGVLGAADSNVLGASSYDSSAVSVDWEHDLTPLTELQLGIGYRNDDYSGISREDDFVSAYIGVSREVARNVFVGVRYDFGKRDSTVVGNDYDSNIFTIGVKTEFD